MTQSTSTKKGNHERNGLFILHPNSDELYDDSKYLVDIVAIHGLGGHPYKTWTEKEDRHLWLRDSLPIHVPEARIMTFGYDSVVLFGKSRSQICDYALDLANRLEMFRQSPQERCRPLLFICHSLGGVVFKEFLVQVTLNKDLEHLAQSVAGVIFLGCPHRGSRIASHARLLSKLINSATLGTGCVTSIEADNRDLLDALFCLDPKAAQMRPRQSQNGTCEWIFSHPKYVHWLESIQTPLLLLTGVPGSESCKTGGKVFELTTKNMWEALRQVLSMQTMSRVIIVIDAIEELGTAVAAAILAGLSEIANNPHRQNIHLKAFISSRPSTGLRRIGLKGLEVLHLGDVDMKSDIEKYLQASIVNLRTENESFDASVTPDLEQRIVLSISKAAAGMFLMAVIAWEDFQRGLFWIENTIDEKLDEVLLAGTSMAKFYDKLIERIDDSVLEDIFLVFSILAAAARPMFEVEVGTILEREVTHLVSIQDDGTLAFVHLSFKDYLESQDHYEHIIETGRQSITKACLIYLKLEDLLKSASIETEHSDKSIYSLNSLWPEGKYYGTTPLRYVLSNMSESFALSLPRMFHDHGYDMDERWSSCPGRALQYCCMIANTEFGRKAAILLLELGANPSLPKSPFRSNLGLALIAKAWDLYDELLSHPMTDLSARNDQGGTLLHDQVRGGPIQRVSEMLDLITETDLNAQDRDGYTPLHLGTSLGREDVVRMLLSKPGIRLDLTDRIGRTPLTLATYWGLKSMALVLIEHSEAFPIARGGHLSALVLAAKHGDKDICERLMAACGYRNLCFHLDMSGKGVLHHAAMNDWDDMIETCLRRGGLTLNIDQIDHSGRSALHYASHLGNFNSCRALIQGGASLTLQDRLGRTAVQAAADSGFKECLVLLLESGRVDPSQRDIEGRSLVHWAATLDCIDVMKLVSEMPGVRLDQPDRHGKTPIDIAFICKSKYVGMFLTEKVPHINIYSWDSMYDTPCVEYRAEDCQIDTSYEVDLLEREARRQKLANEEHRQVQLQYPYHLWALVPYNREEAGTKKEDSEKSDEKKRSKDKTSKGKTDKEKSLQEKTSKEKSSRGKDSKEETLNRKTSKDKSAKKKPSKSVRK
ncbi:ankyrin repeats 3 copies domain-containing [Fusarium sporotrichioides]|uniref:Ankyrin repeats 3 copies domain-containing n=1 Tax=Fusarium sporotrichioides TaxID=5514 RepID=A0A395SGF3_FUSSP|nr:ankyrin repeats 3 copies domain-containing [Fusarium sporotrichioides]